MSLFNLPAVQKEKPVSIHPWSNTVKDQYSNKIKYAHNSVRNVIYPKPKQKVCSKNRVKFTVIGNRVTKEFIYCVHLVKGMHKYRWKNFDTPDIRGVSGVEWPQVLNDIKIRFGGLAYCLTSPVVVLYNDNLLGGDKELKDLIEMRYSYHLALNYQKESILQFTNFIKSTGRTCAYLHISIDEKPIGSLVFMLYSDIVPVTCENFLRLCTAKRGGYGGTPIHRIVKDGWIQCGGFGLKNVPMTCENFIIPHDRRGVLGMANAGRHLDCSTQFFVLLQPADWLKHRFVAFGQLIDGEETLRTIEKVETFYESPIPKIDIYKTGILNLDCHGIMINKNANAYIDAHIDDLVAVGELFYEMLMEHVFLEIEFRRIQRLEIAGEGEELPEMIDEGEKKDIRATKRFIRKKEEIQAHVDNDTRQSMGSKHSEKEDRENNDFDVDSYEPEEYSYTQVSPPSEKLPVKSRPYYIPLTDVPYPGEIDSNYDLKRLLKGDYCLESDLDKKGMPPRSDQKIHKNKLDALSHVLSSYKQPGSDESEEEEEEEEEMEFDEDDEREIKKYLKLYAEQVSFSGMTIRRIAKKYVTDNPLLGKTDYDAFTDEEVRRLKLASADLMSRQGKKISISVEPWETHTQIKRRQTGFMRPQDLAKILSHQMDLEEEEDEEQEEEQEKPLWKFHERKVSISVPTEDLPAHKIKRRQTGFVHPDDVAKLRAYKKSITGVADDDEDDDDVIIPAMKDDDEDVEEEIKPKVRITAPAGEHDQHSLRRPTAFVRPVIDDDDDDDIDVNKTRPSVLVRLYDDVALDDDEPVPTLKDYKPLAEMKVGKKNLMLTISSGLKENDLLRKDNYFRQSMTGDDDSFEQIMALQHGKKIARKISSDYVKTIDQIERKPETSIRSVEFARTRPSLTVSQYQMKNQLHAIEMKHKEEKDKDKKKVEHKKDQGKASSKTSAKDSRGLRLPGDTPLYGSHTSMSVKSDHIQLKS